MHEFVHRSLPNVAYYNAYYNMECDWLGVSHFLGVSKAFFDEQLSLITTGLGGLICLILALCMIFHEGKEKSQHSNELSE